MSLTQDHTPQRHQQRKLGSMGYVSPSPTPRAEKRRTVGTPVSDCNVNRHERDREVNVQVVLRCRPLSEDELRLNIPKVISCNEQRREVTVVQSNRVDRTFTFDKVFGPKSQQRAIYDHAITPMVNEVLEGFNCTIFAYGQTGTGKTYTMEGGAKAKGGELPVESGVIPRAVRQIFDTLEAQKADYSMKITFLELYNEEITDLLAPEEYPRSLEDKSRKSISLMEDGKGGVVVRGLEEEVVYSANEIYNLLERGSAKRRTAETLLNKHSSRSHSIFSITVNVKEASLGDEELIKCGKLNLVDLAGSENISRSGAREGRAREAGEINKSLLTLGRVINALVEHSGHIPYRDSKLTRLLRDSLGGKTRTCIIATISPSIHCLEETLSTLDYAYRAKNIKNKPEANQKMSKSVLLKDLYLEMEQMKQDVRAAREKNGVYIPHERFIQDEANKKAMSEKIDQLEFDLVLSGRKVEEFQELYSSEQEQKLGLQNDLIQTKMKFESTEKTLEELQEDYRIANCTIKEKELIISDLLRSEKSLFEHAVSLRGELADASNDITGFRAKIERKNKSEKENQNMVQAFGSQLHHSFENLEKTVVGSISHQKQQFRFMEEQVQSFVSGKQEASKVLQSRIENMKDIYTSGIKVMQELATSLERNASSNLELLSTTASTQAETIENFLVTAISEAEQVLNEFQGSLAEQEKLLEFSAHQQEEALQRSLVSTQLISKTTVDFLENLHTNASMINKVLDESQTEKSRKLADFEKAFKQNSAEEDKMVLEKIAKLLATSSARKADIIATAIQDMDTTATNETEKLQHNVCKIQQVSVEAKREWNAYIEKVESQFQENTFAAGGIRSKMETNLQECIKKVDQSQKLWDNTSQSLKTLNKENAAERESIMNDGNNSNAKLLAEFSCGSSTTDAEMEGASSCLLAGINNLLVLDHEAQKEMESTIAFSSSVLQDLQQYHSDGLSNMRNEANQFTDDYLVDQPTCMTPRERTINIPSLASIQELRTPSFDDLLENMKSTNKSKAPVAALSSDSTRTPFSTIN
ncbi:hypothetical protein AMTRI_Chr03g141330 [Amborella trichopoda]